MISTTLLIGIFLGILIVVVFQFLQQHLRVLTSPGCLILMAMLVLVGFGIVYFINRSGV